MPVGTGIKREKVPFQQVLLQLSPFFWQGDASWAWNTKVPFWTGENQINPEFPKFKQIDDVSGSRRRAAARAPNLSASSSI